MGKLACKIEQIELKGCNLRLKLFLKQGKLLPAIEHPAAPLIASGSSLLQGFKDAAFCYEFPDKSPDNLKIGLLTDDLERQSV